VSLPDILFYVQTIGLTAATALLCLVMVTWWRWVWPAFLLYLLAFGAKQIGYQPYGVFWYFTTEPCLMILRAAVALETAWRFTGPLFIASAERRLLIRLGAVIGLTGPMVVGFEMAAGEIRFFPEWFRIIRLGWHAYLLVGLLAVSVYLWVYPPERREPFRATWHMVLLQIHLGLFVITDSLRPLIGYGKDGSENDTLWYRVAIMASFAHLLLVLIWVRHFNRLDVPRIAARLRALASALPVRY